jgi:hypothetical protein
MSQPKISTPQVVFAPLEPILYPSSQTIEGVWKGIMMLAA